MPEMDKHADLIGKRHELIVIKSQSLKIAGGIQSVQAVAAADARRGVVQGEVYCAFAAFASWGFCVRSRDTT